MSEPGEQRPPRKPPRKPEPPRREGQPPTIPPPPGERPPPGQEPPEKIKVADYWPPKRPTQIEAIVRHVVGETEKLLGRLTPEKEGLFRQEITRRLRDRKMPEEEIRRQVERYMRRLTPVSREVEQILGITPEKQEEILEGLTRRLQEYKEFGFEDYKDIKDVEAEAKRRLALQMAMAKERRWYGLGTEDKERILEAADPEKGGSEGKAWAVIDELLGDIYAAAEINIAEPFRLDLDREVRLFDIRETINKIPYEWGKENLAGLTAWTDHMRRLAHNATFMMETGQGKPDKMADYMQNTSIAIDFMLKTDGVAEAYRTDEQVLNQMRARGDNWIAPEDTLFRRSLEGGHLRGSKFDKEVSRQFREKLKRGIIDGKDYDYDPVEGKFRSQKGEDEFKKNWPEKKISRALSLAKSFGYVSIRFPQIAGAGRRPREVFEGKMISEPYEDFVRPLNPLDSLLAKFGGFGPTVSLYYYLFTGKPRKFESQKEAFEAFLELRDEPEKHFIPQMANFFHTYGGPTGSTWRSVASIPKEDRDKPDQWYKYGLQNHLFLIEAYEEEMKKKIEIAQARREKPPMTEEELGGKVEKWNKDALEIALGRSPLIVARLLIDPDRPQREGGKYFKKYQDKINKMVWGKEDVPAETINEVENEIFVLQEAVVKQKLKEITPGLINKLVKPKLREKVIDYIKAIQKIVNEEKVEVWEEPGKSRKMKLFEALLHPKERHKRSPYSLEISDSPLEKLEAAQAGHIGWLARGWRDYKDLADATEGLYLQFANNFPEARKPEEIVKILKSIYVPLADINRDSAKEVMKNFGKMIIQGASKHHWWLPAPLEGLLYNLWDRPRSYMQDLLGTGAIEWNKQDARNFLSWMRLAQFIDEEEEKELRKELKLTVPWCAAEFLFKWGPAALLMILYSLIKRLYEEIEKELKET